MTKRNKFRKKKPIRRASTLTYKSRDCKQLLREDFNKRCGYCDSISIRGLENFHVDHFAPREKFKNHPDVNAYKNLVYSCPSCNLAKSNYWVSNEFDKRIEVTEGILDPCVDDLDKHFCRNEFGEIVAIGDLAEFVYTKFKFYRFGYSVRWMLDQLDESINQIQDEGERDYLKARFYDVLKMIEPE